MQPKSPGPTTLTRRIRQTNIRDCSECEQPFTASPVTRRKCDGCRADTRPCPECGETYRPTRATKYRCGQCVMRDNPRSYQCPYDYCLEVYAPDDRNPHKCPTPRVKRAERLAVVNGQPDPVVLHGPPVPTNAIGVRN